MSRPPRAKIPPWPESGRDRKLRQLRAAIDTTLADPDDDDAARRAGRLAAIAALLLLESTDDRRALLVAVARDAADAASSPRAASEIEPTPRPPTAKQASTGRHGEAEGKGAGFI